MLKRLFDSKVPAKIVAQIFKDVTGEAITKRQVRKIRAGTCSFPSITSEADEDWSYWGEHIYTEMDKYDSLAEKKDMLRNLDLALKAFERDGEDNVLDALRAVKHFGPLKERVLSWRNKVRESKLRDELSIASKKLNAALAQYNRTGEDNVAGPLAEVERLQKALPGMIYTIINPILYAMWLGTRSKLFSVPGVTGGMKLAGAIDKCRELGISRNEIREFNPKGKSCTNTL